MMKETLDEAIDALVFCSYIRCPYLFDNLFLLSCFINFPDNPSAGVA